MSGPGQKRPEESSKNKELTQKQQEHTREIQRRKELEIKKKTEAIKLEKNQSKTAEKAEVKKPEDKKPNPTRIDKKDLERQQLRGSKEPYDMASPSPRIDNLKKSIPVGDLEIKDLTPSKKSESVPAGKTENKDLNLPKRPEKVAGGGIENKGLRPSKDTEGRPSRKVEGLAPDDKLDPGVVWEFPPEEIRRSDQKLSPQEIAERKSVYRPPNGVGHLYRSRLIAGGHFEEWAKTVPQETVEAARRGEAVFVVTSFASTPGTKEGNQDLTDGRANTVAMRISGHFGIPLENIILQSLGDEPAASLRGDSNQDNRTDRITLIDVIPKEKPTRTDKPVEIKQGDPSKLADRMLDAFPPPLEDEWKQHAWDAFSAAVPGPTSLRPGPAIKVNPMAVVAKFGVLGFKKWIEANAQARENFQASANFIPAFMGETTRLTTGKAEFQALQPGSNDAFIGRYLAQTHYLRLSNLERRQLTSIMQDEGHKKEFLTGLEGGLRKRFIFK